MAQPEHREAGRALVSLLVFLLVVGLGGAVLYLAADLNQRKYRLVLQDNHLVVERGRFFPLGFTPYMPDVEALRDAYAPLPVLPLAQVDATQVFDDRADLDRALYALLSAWARQGLEARDDAAFAIATQQVRRAELLQGLSEEQRRNLHALRSQLGYRNGRRLVSTAIAQLKEARDAFRLAREVEGRPADIDPWLGELERRIPELERSFTQPAALVDRESSQRAAEPQTSGRARELP